MTTMDIAEREKHWARTRKLMITHLIVWFIFSFVVHAFVGTLNHINFFGWPLGYYFAAQGSLAVFVIQLFIFVKQQDNIDREFGVAED